MTKNMKKTKFILLYLAVGLLFVNTAVAIDVPDGTFDEHDVSDGDRWEYLSDVVDGDWLATGEGASGSPWIANNYGGDYPTMGHTGAQWVDVNADYVYQGLSGETYEKGASYELSVWATTTSASQGLNFLFLDGDTLDLETPIFDSGIVVVEVEDDFSTWSQYSVSYTATADDDGKAIGIGFYGESETYIDTVTFIAKGVVEPITPTRGAEMVAVDAVLEWTLPVGFDALGYDVYFGTDPNSTNRTLVVDNESGNTFDPFGAGDLDYETTYYWWVDVYEPNTLPDYTPKVHKGLRWSFMTEPEAPVILSQPATSRVGAGATAVFSVEQVNGVSYEWFKVGVAEAVGSGVIDGSMVTLTIEGVDESDEGNYFCKLTGQGNTVSENARLVIAKLISHWEFEGDLVDSVGSNDGSAFGVASFAGEGNGMVGNALSLDGIDPNGVVIIGYSSKLNDDAFTVALWAKIAGGSGTWRSPLTSRSEAEGSTFGYNLYASTGDTWQFWTADPANWQSIGSSAVVEDEWVFLASTYDSRTLEKKLYVNGELESQVVLDQLLDVNPAPNVLNIGGRTSLDPESIPGVVFDGLIDDVKIWNYPLNPYAVAKLYTDVAGGTVCVEPELLLYDFDGSCRIDIGDIAVFASRWLGCNFAPDCLDEHTYKLD